MGGVRDETPLTLDVTLDAGHHRVEGVGQLPQVVAATPHADPVAKVAPVVVEFSMRARHLTEKRSGRLR
ncbi:hypothetical protein [Tessaracoccus flavescens]|uniref:hypothetical protein n=1 Tax=Tessaracoccus flavescens TaxID=399497 RepID=UPI000984523B|nr:hypothetical protein [Tessaracoccus flavescens]